MTIRKHGLFLKVFKFKNDQNRYACFISNHKISLIDKQKENFFNILKRNESSKSLDLTYHQPQGQKEESIGQINFKRPILKSTSKGNFYHEKVVLGYSREQMCDLVFDVRKYKEFLPFCLDSQLIDDKNIQKRINLKLLRNSVPNKIYNSSKQQVELPTSFKAKLEIGYPPIRESYISHVSMVRPETVKAISKDTNLFEYLINEWKFHSYYDNSGSELSKNACIVEFYVSFNFRSALYNKFSSLLMDQIYKKMLGAFIKRAASIYGKPSIEARDIR